MVKLLADPFARKVTGWSQLRSMAVTSFSAEQTADPVAALKEDRTRIFQPLGIVPDQWQRDALNSKFNKLMLLCSRQSGKSQTLAGMALVEALEYPGAEVLIISRTLRQSAELMRKVKELWRGAVGGKVYRRRSFKTRPLHGEVSEFEQLVKAKGWDGAALVGDDFKTNSKELKLSHEFPNDARITCLPGNPDNIVGFSAVTLLIIDEASRVSDALMNMVSPFLAVSEQVHGRPGRLVVASTPCGKRGWFWEAWDRTNRGREAWLKGVADAVAKVDYCPYSEQDVERRLEHEAWGRGRRGEPANLMWETVRVTADQCPRITKQFLEDERATLGSRWYSQEYETAFVDLVDAVFAYSDVHDMIDGTIQPMKLWCD